MGKKRVIKKGESGNPASAGTGSSAAKKKTKRRVASGLVYINSTYNNTIITVTDEQGSVLFSGSAGSLGFSGAKKGTPYAASKVAGFISERARSTGFEEARIFVRGIGAGRESAIRSLSAGGIAVTTITDLTPVPFNGPRPPKPRRV